MNAPPTPPAPSALPASLPPARALSPEALDFAPGLLSIQESPPGRLPRVVLYATALLFAILLAWALFGQLDIIASAEGRLVPQSYVQIVQPADAGIVEEILVREGQNVRAGEVLMRMDTRLAQADRQTLDTELALRSLQLRRIEAELSGQPLKRLESDTGDLFGPVEAQYRDHRQAFEDAVGQAREGLTRARRDYESGREILAKLKEITPLLKEQADAFAAMGRDGYAAQVTVRERQREYLESARDLRAQGEAVAGLSAAVAQAEKQLRQIESQYRSELQNERIEAEGQYRRLQQESVKLAHKSGLLELKAPQAGIVKDLATHTVGAVVSPGTVVLTLVPENEPLLAEVMIRNDDVGFVHAQQSVKVKLAAYPFQKYGMLDGTVIHVGPDASEGNAPASNDSQDNAEKPPAQLTYKALVALESQLLEARGQTLRLVPGMQVVAEIHQGRRTVMEYLLSPVQKTLYESGRER
ncbi:MAG: HlyD family type I secretion periplasmic adaptor subunit [Candidatus Accumulibacter sp.]|jgi:HlyD family secretion protein|nr:HlyD family type I secretion periplasmic adaptor subunit [Accumulibacter sp.]